MLLSSKVSVIGVHQVRIQHKDEELVRPNDAVIVCAGGELPTPLLRKVGIEFETKFGTR